MRKFSNMREENKTNRSLEGIKEDNAIKKKFKLTREECLFFKGQIKK